MSWEREYNKNQTIWGEKPSELAIELVKHFINYKGRPLQVLDIGCGYGRDSLYIAKTLGFKVIGIDISEKAIELAVENSSKVSIHKAEFKLIDYKKVNDCFDVILVSNLFHLLSLKERSNFPNHIYRLLVSKGVLFLNALSINDNEHYGIGNPVLDEENSWIDNKYIHLSTENELRSVFSKLAIKELYEHHYEEPHSGERTHNHIAWILVAEKNG
ncbi:class I SAM-dependent methyltransferase [Candidatus Bathyarchaeota archaeon]|nr:class I SAM-dependent methyltransferase [Candidatus Bathyarchaeota archaeon]